MSEVLQANIFFMITGIAVIVFSSLLCVALFHFIKVLRTIRRILDKVEAGAEVISEDLENVRAYFTEDGFVQRSIASLVGGARKPSAPRASAKTDKKKTALKIKDES